MSTPPICNYEGSRYQSEFWVPERSYEDAVERVALRALLPPTGRRLAEIGAGFGRLADLYAGYDEVILLDYARSQLQQAQERLGESDPGGRPRYRYVMASFYQLPLAPGLLDVVTMVRTLHHAADGPAVLRQAATILAPGGTFVLEFANKCNLKAILRYLLHRQNWSPFAHEPVEFVALNYNFHPAWVRQQLAVAGLCVQATRTVSHLRLDLLKRILPLRLLVALDRLFQPTGALWQLTPSAFVRATAAPDKPAAPEGALFRCTRCGSLALHEDERQLTCVDCRAIFSIEDGIYNLRGEEE